MGIEHRYKLNNPELFNGWHAEIQDWGTLHRLVIFLPNDEEYSNSWCKSLMSAKLIFAKEMGQRGAIWIIDKEYEQLYKRT
jgi:hypothetical protein